MVIDIPCHRLLALLKRVAPAVDKKGTLPVLSHVLLHSNGETLTAVGTNLETRIASSTDHASDPFRILVPPKLFELAKLTNEAQTLSLAISNNSLRVTSGKSRYTMTMLDPDGFPDFSYEAHLGAFCCESGPLASAIRKTSHSMANNDVRYYLNGLFFEIQNDDDKISAVTSDGHRLSFCETPIVSRDIKNAQIIIPRNAALSSIRPHLGAIDATVEIQLHKSTLTLNVPGLSVSVKLIDGRYPDWRRVVAVEATDAIDLPREALLNMLKRVALSASDKYHGIKLESEKGLIRLKSADANGEEGEEVIELADSPTVSAGFNAEYLSDAIRVIESDIVRFEFAIGVSVDKLRISDPNDDTHWHVVMPMRL